MPSNLADEPISRIGPDLVSTGVSGLDDILGGGLDADRLYLIEGRPGAGKTTLALQFLLEGVRRGERGLYVTLSESEAELRVVAARHGWSLDELTIFELTPEASLAQDRELTIFQPAELELSETTTLILDQVRAIEPVRIVFDSLSEMRLLAQDALRYRRQILALKQFFAGRKATVLLLDDLTSQATDLQLHSISNGVITLEQLALEYGAERRRLRVVKMRGMAFRGGYHDFKIVRGGLSVFPRLVAAEHHKGFLGGHASSGNTELDALLGGGLDRGTSTLLIGSAGVGKSSIALNYTVAAAERGERSSIFVFDEGLATIYARTGGLGMPFQAHVEAGSIRVQQIDPAEMSPGEFAWLVRRSVEQHNAQVVVIDSLNGYLNAMPEERFLTLQLHELSSYLNQLGVLTIFVLAQHGLMGQTEAPVDVSYLSDAVIMLRYFESEGRVRRVISVMKKRSGRHEDTIREFQLGSDGIKLGPPITDFSGIFTGTPVYIGESRPLLRRNDGRDDS
jgi:circadian clock protein KaiC